MPFTVDLHFGYRDAVWTSDEMDMDKTTSKIETAKINFSKKFEDTFINPTDPSLVESGFLK